MNDVTTPPLLQPGSAGHLPAEDGSTKPKRKPQRRKMKNKLAETYPVYLQEAFFGKELLMDCAGSAKKASVGTADPTAPLVRLAPLPIILWILWDSLGFFMILYDSL